MKEVTTGVLLLWSSLDARDSKQRLTGASLGSIICSHLKSKEQFKELKGRTGTGGRCEKKKFKIVMEELAIMNSFLIPLWQMLVIIP